MRPVVVGILNVTPDSFSDGGRFAAVEAAVAHARQMVSDGADVIDIGGESTRPGSTPVAEAEELARVIPVVTALARDLPDIPISIDTTKSAVARCALQAGARIVNDVGGFRLDPAMAGVCAEHRAGVILMHSRGDTSGLATYDHATYGDDVAAEIRTELERSVDSAIRAGVARERIVVDPGIGFAKRSEHSVAVLAHLERICELGLPVIVGVSRKRFVGELTGRSDPSERLAGTIAANICALERGAMLFRVHDVRENREALDVAWAIMKAGSGRPLHGVVPSEPFLGAER